MRVKKFASIVLMVGVCVSILAGCGNSSDDSKSSGSSKGGSNEIVFWNPFTGPDGSNIKAMVDEYNKTNPEFKVKNVSMKEGDMYTKIPTVVNSGKNIPDLNIIHAERIKQYKDNDMLQAYDDTLTDYPEIKAENYVPESWNIGDLDGSRYSVPLDIHTSGTYYNKELVEKYTPNALDDNIITYDEIKEAGEKAQKDDVSALGVTWMKPILLSLYKQHGGELSSDGIDPTLDNSAMEDSIALWKELYDSGITTKDGEDPYQLFVAGKVMFYPEGIWMRNDVNEAQFEWGLTNAPQISDDLSKAVNWSSSHQFVMFKNENRSDEKTKGIMDFLEWVRTNSLEWAKAGQNPATLDLLNNDEYLEMPQSMFINDPAMQETLTIFDYKYNGYVSEYMDAHALDVIFGKAEVSNFAPSMQKEVADKVAKDNSNK